MCDDSQVWRGRRGVSHSCSFPQLLHLLQYLCESSTCCSCASAFMRMLCIQSALSPHVCVECCYLEEGRTNMRGLLAVSHGSGIGR